MPIKEITFAHTLKKLREEHKITQSKLAEILGLDQTAISKYERGIQLPEVSTLIKIANYFNVSLEKLMYDVEVEAKKVISEADDLIGLIDTPIALEKLAAAGVFTIDGEVATTEEIKRAILLTKLDRKGIDI